MKRHEKACLLFEEIPSCFRERQRVTVVQYELSGIQAFLFGGINDTTTIAEVSARSSYIQFLTEKMAGWISEQAAGYYTNSFSKADGKYHAQRQMKSDGRHCPEVLSKSSGKIILAFPEHAGVFSGKIRKERLQSDSEKLQRMIFATTEGTLEMYFALCDAYVVSRADRADKTMNVAVRLSQLINEQKYHCTNLLNVDMEKDNYTPMRMPPACPEKMELPDEESRLVAVKLDLDNLGSFFHGISAFDQRQEVSRELNEVLNKCCERLNEKKGTGTGAAKASGSGTEKASAAGSDTMCPNGSRRVAWPIFVGGDDLFLLMVFDDYYIQISRFHQILKEEIGKKEALRPYLKDSFGISGGVAVIWQPAGNRAERSRIPLVYYYHRAEELLEEAKSSPGKNVIRVEDTLLTWEQLDTLRYVLEAHGERIFLGAELLKDNCLKNVEMLAQTILERNRQKDRQKEQGENQQTDQQKNQRKDRQGNQCTCMLSEEEAEIIESIRTGRG